MLRSQRLKPGCKPILWTKAAILVITSAVLVLGSTLAVRLHWAYQESPQPQAILVLEGKADRVPFAVAFSQRHPTLPI